MTLISIFEVMKFKLLMVLIVGFLASYFLMSSSIEKLDLNLLAGICTLAGLIGTAICG